MIKVWKNRKLSLSVGVGLIILSVILYISIFLIPFLNLSVGLSSAIIATLIVLGEITFWLGSIMAGKEVIKSWLAKSKSKQK